MIAGDSSHRAGHLPPDAGCIVVHLSRLVETKGTSCDKKSCTALTMFLAFSWVP